MPILLSIQFVKLNPDLVILDMSLKSGSGLDVIKHLRSKKNVNADLATRILVHSTYEDSLYARRVLHVGAMGFVNNQESPQAVLYPQSVSFSLARSTCSPN